LTFPLTTVGLSGPLLAGLLVILACARPPVDRPREGAQPSGVGGSSGRLVADVPPTLAPAASLLTTPTPVPQASPAPPAANSPVASPGIYPVISQIRPSPGAELPPGDVTIGARVIGSSPLIEVQAFVDGELVPAGVGSSPGTTVTLSFVRQMPAGTHEVRIQARDARGQVGGYRWSFVVGERQPLPTPTRAAPASPRPLPTFTLPTLVPRVAPVASPGPR
jgi:hypothetical protein